jgi:hypothetical protein
VGQWCDLPSLEALCTDFLARCTSSAARSGVRFLFRPAVGAVLLRQGDAFPLPLTGHGAFEFGEGAHHGEHEVGHGGVLPGEDQTFSDELYAHALTGQSLDQ